MKRTLFESQTVDMSTGEIISSTSVKVSKFEETFGMHRTTEGIDWIYQFKGNELHCLITLSHIEDIKTGVVTLSPLKRKAIAKALSITLHSLSRIITQLQDKDALVKLSDSDILLNPYFFYKGGTVKWKSKKETYDEAVASKKK